MASKRIYLSGAEKRKKKKFDEEKWSKEKGSILKCTGAPDSKPEEYSELPEQDAPVPSHSSGSVQEAVLPPKPPHFPEPQKASSTSEQPPIYSKPLDPANWPTILSDAFRTDAVDREWWSPINQASLLWMCYVLLHCL
ncbi:uncharacterized protein LOC143032426 isoform X2 [Oratosquilla oratoria]|uniref:uncharacterized protein LOC143032426 isoform X2 n=1 Tax=Oratosquilla oratoria TaxID=337810 RepID=UPI003F7667DC